MTLCKKQKIRIYILLLFVVSLPLVIGTEVLHQTYLFFNSSSIFVLFIKCLFGIRLLCLMYFLLLGLKLFYFNVIKNQLNQSSANIQLLKTVLLTSLLFLEISFFFIPQSQGNLNFGYANQIWQLKYDTNLNELKYRDVSIKQRKETHKKKIFFLGDSFTRGNGIKKIENMFSNIIKQKLNKNNIEIFNLGQGNSDTKDELERLKKYPIKPDVLVLQYYHNDMQPTGERFGHYKYTNEPLYKKIGLGMTYLISKTSFFINYVIINAGAKFVNSKLANEYKQEITNSYNDTLCFNAHLNDMQNVINYCNEHKIKLYVLLIPELINVNFTQTVCFNKIEKFLVKNNTPFISLTQALKPYKPQQLIVNTLDNHANEFTQTIIANEILKSVSELN